MSLSPFISYPFFSFWGCVCRINSIGVVWSNCHLNLMWQHFIFLLFHFLFLFLFLLHCIISLNVPFLCTLLGSNYAKCLSRYRLFDCQMDIVFTFAFTFHSEANFIIVSYHLGKWVVMPCEKGLECLPLRIKCPVTKGQMDKANRGWLKREGTRQTCNTCLYFVV